MILPVAALLTHHPTLLPCTQLTQTREHGGLGGSHSMVPVTTDPAPTPTSLPPWHFSASLGMILLSL